MDVAASKVAFVAVAALMVSVQPSVAVVEALDLFDLPKDLYYHYINSSGG